MHTTSRPTYYQHRYWRQYMPFLPPSLALPENDLPAEAWWAWQDCQIHLDRYDVSDSPATLIMVHGAGGYGRLFAPFGRLFKQAGYSVIAPDLPGYGLSQAPDTWFDHAAWVNCLCDLIATERAKTQTPVVLFGASLGGYLSYLAAAQSQDVAGVIATTLADPRERAAHTELVRQPWMAYTLGMLPMFDRLAGSFRLPIRWFSNMKAVANTPGLAGVFVRDPCGGGNKAPVHFMRALFEATPSIEPERFAVCPVLYTQPAADRWTTLAASQPVYDALNVPKSLVMLEHCGHYPIEEPGITQFRAAALTFLSSIVTPVKASG